MMMRGRRRPCRLRLPRRRLLMHGNLAQGAERFTESEHALPRASALLRCHVMCDCLGRRRFVAGEVDGVSDTIACTIVCHTRRPAPGSQMHAHVNTLLPAGGRVSRRVTCLRVRLAASSRGALPAGAHSSLRKIKTFRTRASLPLSPSTFRAWGACRIAGSNRSARPRSS